MQEAYVALTIAIQKHDPTRGRVGWSSYLYKSIKRHLINKHRRRRLSLRQLDEGVERGYSENLSQGLEIAELRSAFEKLTPSEQRLLRSRFGFDGEALTLRDYATMIDSRHETERIRENKALEKLKEMLHAVETDSSTKER